MVSSYFKFHTIRRGTRAGVATRAAAYRAGESLFDERTGNLYKFAWRQDVRHSEIVVPSAFSDDATFWARDRSKLWNAVEHAERRRNSRVAREYTAVLPQEFTHKQRLILSRAFAQFVADRFLVAVDFSIHEPRPGRATNHHAHFLSTTREVTQAGLGSKASIERQRADYWRFAGAELSAARKAWMDELSVALTQGWRGRLREAVGIGRRGTGFDRGQYGAGSAETSPLSWAAHAAKARAQGVDVEQLRRADRRASRLTPEERELVQERKRAIRLRAEAVKDQKRDNANELRRARRAATPPHQASEENRARRAQYAARYQQPEFRARILQDMRDRYARRSDERVDADAQRKRENYQRNAAKYKQLSRKRYYANLEASRAQRRAYYWRTVEAEEAASAKRDLSRQAARVAAVTTTRTVTIGEIQRRAVEKWQQFSARKSQQPAAKAARRRRDYSRDYSADYSR